jgi:hypothetical protein
LRREKLMSAPSASAPVREILGILKVVLEVPAKVKEMAMERPFRVAL